MENDYKLMFIKNKLEQIKSAVMYTTNNNIVRLPNDIVEFESVDDDGLLWFSATCVQGIGKKLRASFSNKTYFLQKRL
jgi:hypothetical protein